ncbi:multidrug effflux MFS transporter [Nocardioides massiliensis]|uniref:DHA1 family bicyclomycin/chloramphenicol resistance-like MFS transporter n=1 Tax=Nocardioides massiliensis TaxID=1325935 RepID=A0ABT9NL80_9ACTN|nr:multidrug effflux MFS transporter [Nocardioides massiliensis]MDP9820595.1 DHA1 family bicyclomycin/chloramphenicol resistance-like MFS transporter [Nocardioides massiliensis]
MTATPVTASTAAEGQREAVRREAGKAPLGLVLILGSLSAFAPMATDFYLPGLPAMAADLDTRVSLVQLTLTVFVIGLALGQLVVGPLSDAWGRRRPLLTGLVVYVTGSLVCVAAPTVEVLIAGRVIQALGASAAIVLSRAIVRDLYSGTTMTRFFSTLMLVSGAAPVLAPVLGAQVIAVSHWRVVFGVLVLFGVVLLIAVALRLPESLPPARRQEARLLAHLRRYAHLLRDLRFVAYIAIGGLMFASLFVYISSSPFVLQEAYGFSVREFSLVFAVNGAGIVTAGQLNRVLVGRFASELRLLGLGVVVGVAAVLTVLVAVVQDWTVAVLVAALFPAVAVFGMVVANATSLALAEHAASAGAASSLQGMVQFLTAGVAAAVVGLAGEGSALAMALGMTVCMGLALVVLVVLVALSGGGSSRPRRAPRRAASR